jgi:hypothetical protein
MPHPTPKNCPLCNRPLPPKSILNPQYSTVSPRLAPEDSAGAQCLRILTQHRVLRKEAWLFINYDINEEYHYYIVPPQKTFHQFKMEKVDTSLHQMYQDVKIEKARRKNFEDLREYIKMHNLEVTQCLVIFNGSNRDPTPAIHALTDVAEGSYCIQPLFRVPYLTC